VVALALVSTVGVQLIFYRMILMYGVARTTVGGYLVPAAALLLGAAILGEPVTAGKVLGLILILVGVAIGSGVVRRGRTKVTADAT
jgi:drug/metabolite transporter (DMT)-like permease